MKLSPEIDVKDESQWQTFFHEFKIRTDTVYLNHGSFGIPLNAVRYKRRYFSDRLDEQPMDFFVRQLEPLLKSAKQSLAEFVGTQADNLVFAQNATYAMNVVANSFVLSPGDEVLLTDHEYGAVEKIWQQACETSGAKITYAKLPGHFETKEEVVDCLAAAITPKTKLAVISHITSQTALIMPMQKICDMLNSKGVAICIDGPHALLQTNVPINGFQCDFYCASCHKWLCAPLGSGFLYVNPKHHESIKPVIKSWGRLDQPQLNAWHEEFVWRGTQDPACYLAIPTAIEYFKELGIEKVRERLFHLADRAEHKLSELFKTQPLGVRGHGWYGSMAHVPLPPGDWDGLQGRLWKECAIEVPVWNFQDRWYIRVSCHLYNSLAQIDMLCKSLKRLMD